MFVSDKFFNIKCDCCGSLLDEDCWQGCEQFCEDSAEGWIKLDDGRHICPSCWKFNKEDETELANGEIIEEKDYRLL